MTEAQLLARASGKLTETAAGLQAKFGHMFAGVRSHNLRPENIRHKRAYFAHAMTKLH